MLSQDVDLQTPTRKKKEFKSDFVLLQNLQNRNFIMSDYDIGEYLHTNNKLLDVNIQRLANCKSLKQQFC